MKIRFIQTLSTNREVFRRGQEHDLHQTEAAEYIRAGVAAPLDAPQPPAVEAANTQFDELPTVETPKKKRGRPRKPKGDNS